MTFGIRSSSDSCPGHLSFLTIHFLVAGNSPATLSPLRTFVQLFLGMFLVWFPLDWLHHVICAQFASHRFWVNLSDHTLSHQPLHCFPPIFKLFILLIPVSHGLGSLSFFILHLNIISRKTEISSDSFLAFHPVSRTAWDSRQHSNTVGCSNVVELKVAVSFKWVTVMGSWL